MRHIPAVAQDDVRDRVIAAIHNGLSQAEAARIFSIPDRSIRRWVAQMRRDKVDRIVPKRRGRRMGTVSQLSPRQAARLRAMIVGKMPEQLHLSFYLWTRQAVGDLIKREYGVKLTLASIGNWLARWGLTAQQPVRRAYERNDAKIAAWLSTDYPQIARRAKARRALIYWADECGVRSDDVRGRSYAPRGQTPAVAATGQRYGCNMISALNNRGGLAFQTFSGGFVVATFIGFLERLLKHAQGRKVVLIVDGHPVHRAKLVKAWLAEHSAIIEMHLLPGYAPELNPDELLNHDVKIAMGKSRPRSREDLRAKLRAHLHRRQKQPHVVRNFFRGKHVRYAA
jgi:transposase